MRGFAATILLLRGCVVRCFEEYREMGTPWRARAGARAARTRAERDCDAAERRRRAEPTFPRAFWDDAQSALVLPDAAGPPPLSALALPDGARDAAGAPPPAGPPP